MYLLGIDTSTKFLCIGIMKEDKIVANYNRDLEKRHAQLLIPILNKLLKKAKISLKDIHGFACGIGPGSFTGLRIGLSTIKAFSFGLRRPVVAIPSLDIIAKNINDTNKLVCVMVDAKRNLVYNAFYKVKNNKLTSVSKYKLSSVKDVLKSAQEKTLFMGDAVKLYEPIIRNQLKNKAHFTKEEFWYPKANKLLEIAQEKFSRKQTVSIEKLLPLYLYPKECQIKRR